MLMDFGLLYFMMTDFLIDAETVSSFPRSGNKFGMTVILNSFQDITTIPCAIIFDILYDT